MKNFDIDFREIPKRLYGKCYKDSNLCLICKEKFEQYKKNPFGLWDILPQNCKLEGWFFIKREIIKQKIRKKKEKILSLETKLQNSEGIKQKRIEKEITRHKKEIEIYSDFDSVKW